MNAPQWNGDDGREFSDPPDDQDAHDCDGHCPICEGVDVDYDDGEEFL